MSGLLIFKFLLLVVLPINALLSIPLVLKARNRKPGPLAVFAVSMLGGFFAGLLLLMKSAKVASAEV